MTRKRSVLALVGFGAAVGAAAWFGARFSPANPDTREWYLQLKKPPYNPPNAVFPIVWPILYILMTIAAWRTWRRQSSAQRSLSLTFWWAQLAANALWTYLFFGKHNPKQALIDILVMESLILGFIIATRKLDRTAAVCFLPYAAWVGFATLLNAQIIKLNP